MPSRDGTGPPLLGASAVKFTVKRQSKIAALLLLTLIGSAVSSSLAEEEYDLIIKGGRIIDGTGNPWFRADLGVKEGRIAKIGNLERAGAKKVIDATGLVVAPGFIDMHNHSDQNLDRPDLRLNEPFITQGVTTLVLGVDGRGPWDIESRVAVWKRQGIGTNVAFYVGHNLIRTHIMGIEDRAPTEEELERMKALVKQGMENGAFGLSTGLEYIPGIYSRTDEVIELAKVAASYGGIYDSHYRDEFYGFLDSVREAIEIAEKANIPVNLGHFKVIGKHNWGKMPEAVRLIEEARARGLEITADQYPWDNGATGYLHDLLQVPPGLGRISDLYARLQPSRRPDVAGLPQEEVKRIRSEYLAELIKALKDPELRDKIREATEKGLPGPESRNWIKKWGYDWMRVVRSRKHPEYLGQVIAEICSWKGVDAFTVVSDLIVAEGEELGVSIGPLSEEDVITAMKQPWVMHSSDGSLVPFGQGFVHPRSYGSFPRVLGRYVREKKMLGLEEAVRKMTSLPAQTLRLRDRGLLREGFWADITIFDPETIIDKATYIDPHQYSEGIFYVLVNGQIVLERGEMTGAAPGKILYRPGSKNSQ